ncbi:membrane fusion protein Use1-domain-containing protein [Chytriomyces cf. hyalinus JEL632]|nr:membrane fusion protein Use1-domain-containing protein [Chytriomyces cf. hyalinus JEL632]
MSVERLLSLLESEMEAVQKRINDSEEVDESFALKTALSAARINATLAGIDKDTVEGNSSLVLRIRKLADFASDWNMAACKATDALLSPSTQPTFATTPNSFNSSMFKSAPWVKLRETSNRIPPVHQDSSSTTRNDRDELLRKRNVYSNASKDDERPTDSDDSRVLKEQVKAQEALSEDLIKLAQRLKENSLLFGDTLKADKEVLDDTHDALNANVTKISSQNSKLTTLLQQTRGNCFMITGAVLLVCVLFIFTFFWMRLFRVVKT